MNEISWVHTKDDWGILFMYNRATSYIHCDTRAVYTPPDYQTPTCEVCRTKMSPEMETYFYRARILLYGALR